MPQLHNAVMRTSECLALTRQIPAHTCMSVITSCLFDFRSFNTVVDGNFIRVGKVIISHTNHGEKKHGCVQIIRTSQFNRHVNTAFIYCVSAAVVDSYVFCAIFIHE